MDIDWCVRCLGKYVECALVDDIVVKVDLIDFNEQEPEILCHDCGSQLTE